MAVYNSYRRMAPPLPDPDSLPFPGNLVRRCTDCPLHATCKAPVPGKGPTPADIMLVGQNPGFNEGEWGEPFVGQAGQYLNSLLFHCGVSRDSIYITNMVKCLTPNNRELKPDEIRACAHWLDMELGVVNPRIIVAMGKPAIDHFLGKETDSVEKVHGKPVIISGRIILPAYHPAAALHNTTLLRQVGDDFNVLRGLARGESPEAYIAQDEYPNPEYIVVDTPEKHQQMLDEIRDVGECAIDEENVNHNQDLWSVQVSAVPGKAWFVPMPKGYQGTIDTTSWGAHVIVHYYLNDSKWIKIRDDDFTDTMTMAYLCGLPQGLKDLAYRLCGVKMQTYKETVRPGQRKLSEAYLVKASKRSWKDPPPIFETKWNNKQGCIVTRQKKPWHISRKIQSILDKMGKDPEYDPYDAWCKGIDPLERAEVEETLGLMPESSLADIKFEDAVNYACRDAMMTLRVKHKMQDMMTDLGLDFISRVDHGILPMVQDMMKNGMAIDLEHYKKLSEDYDIRLRVKAAELAGMVGHAFNPGSSLQVAAVMYSELGFKPTKYTQTKEICTDDQELKKIKDSETGKIHPVSQKIIQYRGLMKLKTTYADNMIKSARPDEDGVPRMHTKLNTTRVETGRLSSSKNPDTGEGTNLQNIPTRNKEAKAIKNGFIAPSRNTLSADIVAALSKDFRDKVIAEGDYGQIEMVTLADMSGCKRLIELFNRGGDPHTEMAAKIFDVPLNEAEKSKYRYPVKRLNFGIAYLIGAQGLSNQIQEYIADLEMEGEPVEIEAWPEDTCERFIAEWYKLNPEVKDMQMEFAAMARRYGYVKDKFGRIRYIPEVACPIKSIQEAGLRQAANMPITATAQGIIKLAMGQLWRELPKTEWAKHVKFLMQIHDSLIDEITDDEKIYKPYLAWKGKIMTSVVQLKVPIKVDFKVGKRWGDLQKCKV